MQPPARAPHVLVVDDDEGLLLLMAEALLSEHYDVTKAASAQQAEAALARRTPDLMILDLKLHDGEGPDLVERLRSRRPGVPFVIVTGQGDEKVAVNVMKQGALDYVMKDTGLLDLLPAVVKRALETVAAQQALHVAHAEQKRLEREVLAVGERERHSIGADLHDNLGQQLTALELMCTALKADAEGHPVLASRLKLMGQMLREAIAQTRFLARGLVPVGEEPEALQIGLSELAERTDALGRVRCQFACPKPVSVPNPFAAGHLYRIAQEAVNNAVKHARATKVLLRLTRTADELVLEIADDGVGLPQSGTPRGRGIGLGVMQHRADVIGARLTMSTKRGKGLAIRCALPLPSGEREHARAP